MRVRKLDASFASYCDSRGTFELCFVILFKLGQRKRTQVDSVLDESDIAYDRTNS